ncbi:Ornithine cyclodeaminase [Microbacterium esteraromaticum]|uniref:Ornithine cyclodeaminase n=1 Tax=Microbacterium esteraromaticum TaxID=57043 RepID=A0A1R4JZZ8_9MICO|nr:ornithine cyclodeaminase [Microbacterium esteraromaticum]SJN37385.1 Ornithine cyclodeaminase [Microbacterium esteraromaticum]
MTGFVGVADMVRWVARHGAETLMAGMADYIESDFRRWTSFDKTERVASHTPFGVIELMPISDPDVYAFKYVNGHPSNPARGFQTVTAFGMLADVHNGYPVFLSEMTLLTALRTAATSAMVARRLARPDSHVMAMIGAGSQAEFQALAFRGVLGIDRLRVYDVDPSAPDKLVRNLRPHGFEIEVCGSASEAALGADIVTTCTADKTAARVLADTDVAAGMHVNTIGGDCPGKTELDPRILERGPVFVEYAPQTRIEGEIQNVAPDFPVTEFWEVLTGAAAGRTSPEQVTIFDSVGFAIEDYSALRFLRDSVAGTDLSGRIDLVAAPEDPKDLFGMVGAPVPA